MDPALKLIMDKLDDFTKRLDSHDARLDQRFADLIRDLSTHAGDVNRCLAALEAHRPDPLVVPHIAALEASYISKTADLLKRVADLESVRAGDVADDLKLWISILSKPLDRGMFEHMPQATGVLPSPSVLVSAPSSSLASTIEQPMGSGVDTSPWDARLGASLTHPPILANGTHTPPHPFGSPRLYISSALSTIISSAASPVPPVDSPTDFIISDCFPPASISSIFTSTFTTTSATTISLSSTVNLCTTSFLAIFISNYSSISYSQSTYSSNTFPAILCFTNLPTCLPTTIASICTSLPSCYTNF